MARYIDADKLIKKIFPIGMVDDGNYTINAKAVKVAIDKTPTVDVEKERLESASFRFALLDSIKRSKIAIAEHDRELAREIFEEIESEIKLALESNYKAKREHIDKNYYCLHAEFLSAVQGKIDALRGIDDFIAELKKKYTESEGKG